ncbi:MAG: hypothetical protein KAI85_15930 [Halopseudomonas aestusnigri]|nr:hypothetical protein [Halopseudomonas aestusnigri]
MRTYILDVVEVNRPLQRKKFRCQAKSLQQAIQKAEANYPGFFNALKTGGQSNASLVC